MSKEIQVKMAKASDDDLRRVREFFQMIEEVVEYGTWTPDEFGVSEDVDDSRLVELIRAMWNERGLGVGSSWFRVVCGCGILIDNCCDPDVATLEWRPDIAKAMEAAGVESND